MVKNVEQMEIFNRSPWILSPILIAAAMFIVSLHFDVIETSNKPPDIVTAAIVAILLIIAILPIGHTRQYFDNSNSAFIIEFNYIYGRSKKIYPYKDILHIAVYFENSHEGSGYYVELVQRGLDWPGDIKLEIFGAEQSDYNAAVEFAKKICNFAGLAYFDSTLLPKYK